MLVILWMENNLFMDLFAAYPKTGYQVFELKLIKT